MNLVNTSLEGDQTRAGSRIVPPIQALPRWAQSLPGLVTRAVASHKFRFAASSVTDQVLISGSNLVLNLVLARLLSKAAYGSFGVLFSTFVLFSGFFTAFLIEPLSVYGPARYREGMGSYTRLCVVLHGLMCVVLVPLVALFLGWTAMPGMSVWSSTLSVVVCLSMVLLYWLLRRISYVVSVYSPAVTAAVVYNVFLLGAIVAMKAAGALSAPAALCSQAAGAACACGVLLYRFRHHLPKTSDLTLGTVAARHWQYGRWAIGTAIVYWASSEAYYIIVGKLVGAPSVAGFRSVQNLSMLFPNFVTAISVVVLPKLAAKFATGGRGAIQKPVALFTGLSGAAAITFAGCLWLAGGSLLSAFYGRAYAEYAGLFPILCCNLVLITLSQGIQVGLRAMDAPREIFYGFLLAGIFTCTVGVAMTSVWHLAGAVAGLSCSTLLFLSFVTFRYRRLVRE